MCCANWVMLFLAWRSGGVFVRYPAVFVGCPRSEASGGAGDEADEIPGGGRERDRKTELEKHEK